MRRLKFILFAFLTTLVFSCSNLVGEFEFMLNLKESISEKYDTEKVEVKIHNKTTLIVSIKDSRFEELSGKVKQKISHEIGGMVSDLRKDDHNIESGIVKFISEENYGVAKTSQTDSYNMYDKE